MRNEGSTPAKRSPAGRLQPSWWFCSMLSRSLGPGGHHPPSRPCYKPLSWTDGMQQEQQRMPPGWWVTSRGCWKCVHFVIEKKGPWQGNLEGSASRACCRHPKQTNGTGGEDGTGVGSSGQHFSGGPHTDTSRAAWRGLAQL